VAVLVFLIILPKASALSDTPTAKIASIVYPEHVHPGKTFQVTVEAQYSIQSGADIGIWDPSSGVMIESYAIPLPGPGRISFDFKLTAPPIDGEWHLIVITRIWWEDAWYQNPDGGSASFAVQISGNITILLNSEGASPTITIDGSPISLADNESVSILLKPGLHTVEAPSLIQVNPVTRLVFVGWSDGIGSNPQQVVLSDGEEIAPIYRTEYLLSVESDRGGVSGGGWYANGTLASFAAVNSFTATSPFGLLTNQYNFEGWSGDSQSRDAISSIDMNGPKIVQPVWAYSGTSVSPVLVTAAFYLGAIILAIRSLHVYSARRRSRNRISLRMMKRWIKLAIPLSTFLIAVAIVPPAYAQLPTQPARSIVTIGDASWYYWNQNASDTCLLWLGGGITQQSGGDYNQYLINPYEYESFGTIRFLQDLSKYYCVVALEKGSSRYTSTDSNRTIYQEPYQSQSHIITQVHDWIKMQGYAHAYIVGYSVGAEVAAEQCSIGSPEEWTSPDGLILLTPYLTSYQIQDAFHLRGNLLVIYGGSIETPQYVATGQEFYDGTPAEGWHGSYYQHKEYHIIPEMGHEVWTVLKTGDYDTQALHVLMNFVEKSKALQLKPEEAAGIISEIGNSSPQGSTHLMTTTVTAPPRISPDQILVIQTNLSYSTRSEMMLRAIALDSRTTQVENVIDFSVNGDGVRSLNFQIAPPFNSTQISFEIIILRDEASGWSPAEGPHFTTTTVANTLSVTLESNVSNLSITFDGTQHTASNAVQLETANGTHIVQTPATIYFNEQRRAVFARWEDGTSTPLREVDLEGDATLIAYYRMQYFVNATTSYGTLEGGGWYDENSTATVLVEPPIVNGNGELFLHWTGDVIDSSPEVLLLVNSPKTIQAQWEPVQNAHEPNAPYVPVNLLASVLIFVTLLIMNLKRDRIHAP
jgi:hypothetical protein